MTEIEYTPNLALAKQPTGAREWGAVLNENFDKIDESFGDFEALPPQSDNAGKFLTTDGTEASWADVGGGLEIGDIGFAPLGIDEVQNKRRYLNGQVISQSQFVSFTNKVKSAIELYPNLATSETNWQATVTNSKLGQCGKFVIDDELGTIRLPKVVNINGLSDLSLMGSIKNESLPNIKGDVVVQNCTNISSGAFYRDGTGECDGDQWYDAPIIKMDASRSSSTYQDNAPVQQEAVQYPYFIQVATGAEESVDVTREIELNNPFSLLDYKWSEYELSNASWLISNGTFHSGATYISVYNLLLEIYNGTVAKDGVSVKLSTEAYEDTDFVLNTVDTTFRLPIKVKLASGNVVVGNGMTLGLTNGQFNLGLRNGSTIGFFGQGGAYGTNVGTSVSGNASSMEVSVGVTTDSLKSGIETSSDSLKLYFYVGETIQDANVVNASGVLTRVAELSDGYISGLGMPSNKHIDLTLGASGSTYTAPANGWVSFMKIGGASGKQVVLINSTGTKSMRTNSACSSSGQWLSVYLPVQKGDTFVAEYDAIGETKRFRFIYAEGEN